MSRIESLTDEQKARCPEFVKKWTDIGLSTALTDRAAEERGIRLAYEIAGLTPPTTITWFQSPMSLVVGLYALQGKKVNKKLRASVFYGQHESNWLSFYDFMDCVLGLKEETRKLDGLKLIAQSCGWCLLFTDVVLASDRPIALCRDAHGRLHSADDMAIRYADGWGVWSWHGVRVTEKIIRKQFSTDDIDKEENIEVHRAMIEIYGQAKYLLDGKAEKVHQDDFGILYRKEQKDDEPIVMVKVVNSTPEPDGTFKDYFLRVPPTMKTAKESVAWTFGKSEHEYKPYVET